MVIPDVELNPAMTVVGDSYHARKIRSFLAYWPLISRFIDECNLNREIQRSLKTIYPTLRTGVEYRINNEVSKNFIYFTICFLMTRSSITYLTLISYHLPT
jgi:hypothetical protein